MKKKQKPVLRIRALEAHSHDDGGTLVYVPRGMTGRVDNVLSGNLRIFWDAAFICDLDQKQGADPDPDRGLITGWEDEDVPMELVEFVSIDEPATRTKG